MSWQAHPSIVPLLFGSALLWINVGYLLWRRQAGRRAPGQLLAAGLVASIALSLALFAVRQAATTLDAKQFWNVLIYFGDGPLVAFMLAYVLVYIGHDLSRRQYVALFMLPVITIVGVVTNPLHGLHYQQSLGEVGGYITLSNDYGPLFWLYVVYGYAFLLVSIVLLARAASDAQGSYRRQLFALIGGLLLPGIGAFAHITGFGPEPTPNYMGYGYIGTAIAFSYTVYRHDLFGAVPVARRTALEQLDDGDGVVVGCNDAASRFLGRSKDDLLGQPGGETLGPFVSPFDLETVIEQSATVETVAGVFDVRLSPLVRGETTIGWQLLLNDVTDRHRREQRLTALNTRLELALNETDTGVWELDLTSEELVFDEASERLYGYEPGEFPNTVDAFADRLSDADFSDVEASIEQALDSGEEYSADFKVDLPDGSHRWIQTRGVIQYDAEGAPVRVIGIQTNITERKQTQQQLEDQNRRLELLNKLVRHDIRNEAFLISTLARKLDGSHGQSTTATDRVDQIDASSERIIDLTQQAKELMSVISSLGDSLGPIDLQKTLNREIAGASMIETNATIRTEKLPTVDVRANEMLGSLLRNLLTNAIIHNDTNCPEVVVSGKRRDHMLCLTVADNGPGIPNSEREAVLTEGKTLAGSNGTGFGLYLVGTLVKQYGGRISIEDAETLGGAAITICLPIVEESDA
jgi:PAS domain S-box-containing protein